MDLICLLQEQGFSPTREASTNGGEFSSACPKCGGKDRFRIWPNEGTTGRYWCRQCNISGDGIKFAREFIGKSYFDACKIFGEFLEPSRYPPCKSKPFKSCHLHTVTWTTQAADFVLQCHERLIADPKMMEYVNESRGFSKETVNVFKLGYNDSDRWLDRSEWGILPDSDGDSQRKLWLPKGLVVPAFDFNNNPIKIKIRRTDYHEGDKWPKYYEVPGSFSSPVFYGNSCFKEMDGLERPIILVESELDAILIQQLASKYCICLALGGVSKEPDEIADTILRKAPIILYALDWDEAGKRRFQKWKGKFPNTLKACVVPFEKSPGDFYKAGGDIERWICEGLKKHNFLNN